MNNKKIFGMPIVALAIAVLVLGLGTAALLLNFGVIQTNVDAKQSVLVDGKNHNQLTAETLELVGGSSYCSAHTLENRAEVTIPIELTTNNVEGIDVEYNELFHTWTKTQADFNKQDYLFDLNVENKENGDLVITVTDKDNVGASYPMGTVTVFDENGDALFQTGFNTADGQVFKTYNGAWTTAALPDGFILHRDAPTFYDYFTVTIPASSLEDDYTLAFNIERIGVAGAVNARYPTTWAWQSNFEGAPRYGSNPLANEFNLLSGELKHFEICYNTHLMLAPKTYKLLTTVGVQEPAY